MAEMYMSDEGSTILSVSETAQGFKGYPSPKGNNSVKIIKTILIDLLTKLMHLRIKCVEVKIAIYVLRLFK